MYGDRPSSLDVALFAHLAKMKQYPESLQYLVEDYPHLMEFYDQFLFSYFTPVESAENPAISTNQFVLHQQLKIENADKKFCFATRKTPYESKKEESEEERMMREAYEQDKQMFYWRIGSFAGVLTLGGVLSLLINIYMDRPKSA